MFLRVCRCFFSCRALADPPFPLIFLPWERGDSQRFSCRAIFPYIFLQLLLSIAQFSGLCQAKTELF
ncbi:hypothetical protein PL921430065 [Planktothrix tepida PCC 9214]|uniref:Uncharacterized protein n=1 Tax=Planktothrix tepida PCC 9214 TaxID=671072 RepID=A0A1J1LI91_9CYAN|nr:hypothetical protein PL921430065 [Planktothrix tepida PCC 9214]